MILVSNIPPFIKKHLPLTSHQSHSEKFSTATEKQKGKQQNLPLVSAPVSQADSCSSQTIRDNQAEQSSWTRPDDDWEMETQRTEREKQKTQGSGRCIPPGASQLSAYCNLCAERNTVKWKIRLQKLYFE